MASKDSNSLVISLSIFVLLSVGLGVAWYMTWAHSSDLQTQLTASQESEKNSKSTIQDQISQIGSLKTIIGRASDETDAVVTGAQNLMQQNVPGNVAPTTLEEAVTRSASERDSNGFAAADRMNQLAVKTQQLADATAAHQAALQSLQDSLDRKDAELLEKERVHSEQLAGRDKQIDDLKAVLGKTQDAFATYRTENERIQEEQSKEILQQREALLALRREKFKLEGITYERPDGALTSVDQNTLTCFVDLGSRDELRVGTTFSVYRKNNSGVGRSQSDKDLKGKIEVVDVLGDHLAEARIVEQDSRDPMADGDPIYSPIFFPGQKLEIAVVGGLEFDGNPGSDRDEFKRIVSGAGASIVLEVNDEAKLLDTAGTEVSASDIPSLITSKTRFLLVGDLGNEDSQDTVQNAINQKVREHHDAMVRAAENNGVYLLNLASFLDYVGYSRKRLVWTPTNDFPGVLPNGGRSDEVVAPNGPPINATIDNGTYPSMRRRTLQSTGATSGLFRQPPGNE